MEAQNRADGFPCSLRRNTDTDPPIRIRSISNRLPFRISRTGSGSAHFSRADERICAVSGAEIPLEELRYWSVDLQEPYASAEISTRRALGQAEPGQS